MRWLVLVALAACGNDRRPPPLVDAPPAGTPVVAITSPRANESYYVTQNVAVAWNVEDDGPSVSCDVSAATDGGTPIAITTDLPVATGGGGTASWSLAGVPPSERYTIEVSCSDGALAGAATSGAFVVAAPPQQVSYAAQVQPLFASCLSNACHDATNPAQSLNLTAGVSYAELVGVTSTQCASLQLVAPNLPAESYLVAKLAGTGPCFQGTRMPKPPGSILTTAQVQLVRDWIANGAPNN